MPLTATRPLAWILFTALVSIPLARAQQQDHFRYQHLPRPLAAKYAGRYEGLQGLAEPGRTWVREGLSWLAEAQEPLGFWDCDRFGGHEQHDVEVTALALLSYLAEDGLRPGSPWRRRLQAGLAWLGSQQVTDPSGREDGRIGTPRHKDFIYGHTIATLAMVEAYGLSGDETLRDPAQRAVRYLENYRRAGHGWGYEPRSSGGNSAVTAWAGHTLVAAQEFGLELKDGTLDAVRGWFRRVTEEPTGRVATSRDGESLRWGSGGGSTAPAGEALIAASLSLHLLLGDQPSHSPVLDRQVERLVLDPPVWDDESTRVDFHHWFYSSQALRQIEGEAAEGWRAALLDALAEGRSAGDDQGGSWSPVEDRDLPGGRVYATAMALLSLQAPYRYGDLDEPRVLPAAKAFTRIQQALEKRKLKRVADLCEKLDVRRLSEEERKGFELFRSVFQQQQASAMGAVHNAVASTNYVEAKARLERLADEWRGLEPGAAAKKELARFKKAPLKQELRADTALRKLRARYFEWMRGSEDGEDLRDDLADLRKKHHGTTACERAEGLLATMEDR